MLRRDLHLALTCASLTLAACGTRTVDEGGMSGEGGSTESGSTSSDAGSSVSSTDESESASGSGDTSGEVCGPNAGARAQFTLTPIPESGSRTCRLTDAQGPSTDLVYTFDCAEAEPVVLEIDSTLPGLPGLVTGNDYVIRYEADTIFWINRWMAIQLPNTESPLTLLGAISGDALVPPSGSLTDFFGEPDFLTPPFECTAEDSMCGGREEFPLEMLLESGARGAVWHGNSGIVEQTPGGFFLELEYAFRNMDQGLCVDVPAQWFGLVFSRFGGD